MGRSKVRYATKKQVEELTAEVRKLGEAMVEFAKWQLVATVQREPYAYFEPQRKFILSMTKDDPLLHTTLATLFTKNPLTPPISQSLSQKQTEEPQ